MGRKEESTESSPSPIKKFLSQVFSHTHKAITQKKIILQVSISTLEIFLMLLSFVLALWALQIPIEAPWGSVSLILAFSAIAAVALPPSYGAGPGAAIAFMFAILGLSTELAFAYTGLWWILSQVPTIMTGIPSFWLVKSKENMNR
jgi:hypothetical protein